MRRKAAVQVPDEPEPRAWVRFLVREAPWAAGDVTPLPMAQAEKFVRHGVAELEVVSDGRG